MPKAIGFWKRTFVAPGFLSFIVQLLQDPSAYFLGLCSEASSKRFVAPALKRGPKDTSVSIRTTAIQMWSDPEEIYQRRLILFERSRELLRVINTCIFGLWSCIE